MFTKIMAIVGCAFILLLIVEIIKRKVPTRSQFGTIYVKQFPDGSKTYRIQLGVEPQDLKEGDKFKLDVKYEALTPEEYAAVNEILKGVE